MLLKISLHKNNLRILGKSKLWFSWSGVSLEILHFWQSPKISYHWWSEDHSLHSRVKQLLFNPSIVTLGSILKTFGERHWNSTFLCSEKYSYFHSENASNSAWMIQHAIPIRPHLWRTLDKPNKITQIEISSSKQKSFLVSISFVYKEQKLFSASKNFLSKGMTVITFLKGQEICLGFLQPKDFITASAEHWAAWTLKWNSHCCKHLS